MLHAVVPACFYFFLLFLYIYLIYLLYIRSTFIVNVRISQFIPRQNVYFPQIIAKKMRNLAFWLRNMFPTSLRQL